MSQNETTPVLVTASHTFLPPPQKKSKFFFSIFWPFHGISKRIFFQNFHRSLTSQRGGDFDRSLTSQRGVDFDRSLTSQRGVIFDRSLTSWKIYWILISSQRGCIFTMSLTSQRGGNFDRSLTSQRGVIFDRSLTSWKIFFSSIFSPFHGISKRNFFLIFFDPTPPHNVFFLFSRHSMEFWREKFECIVWSCP